MPLEVVPITTLHPHPSNYRSHPVDQIEHLAQSIREHGLYRNIVVACDGTILAGHGVVAALRTMGVEDVPVVRLPLSPTDPRALKILVGDNEIGHLAEIDDRELSELLKSINDEDVAGLLGTGYDERMLANLVYVTRPASEVASFDEAAEWVGMPEYDSEGESDIRLVMHFRSMEDRARFAQILGLTLLKSAKAAWWPPRDRETNAALRFEG